jgi:RND family efflux transporter MFP subunit
VLLRFKDTEQQAALKAAQAGLKEAEARFAEAEAEFNRVQDVFAKKLVSKAALDRANADFEAARQRLEAAKAKMTQAQEQLDHTVVKAPYAGIVVKRHVETGETANIGQPLMTGFALDELRATASVPQSVIAKVRAQSRARVIVNGDDPRGVDANRLTIYPFADPATHTFKVRVDFPAGQTAGLYPGMFAKVAFTTGVEKRLLVPLRAIVHRSEVTAVYVVGDEEKMAFRQIRTGRVLDNEKVEVLAGLEEGERVALDPIHAGVVLKEQQAGGGQ